MKKYIIAIAISLGLMTVSCDDFLDVNTDPNNPVSVTPDLILPVAQTYTAKLMQEDRGINHLGNMMMFNWGESYGFSWYDEEFKYLVTSTFYDDIFDDTYSDILKQYNDLESLSEEYKPYKAISKIMKSFHFQLLVDLYGDIPYSEALQRGALPTPKYDNAKSVYMGIFNDLNTAEALIAEAAEMETSVYPGEDDVMFEGDMDMWIQFSNSIKLRMLVRAGEKLDIDMDSAITAMDGNYITDDVMVNPGYYQDENKQNYYWDELGWDYTGTVTLSHDATCATQYVIDLLTSTNDDRIDWIYEKPETGHLGVNQGADNDDEMYAADYVSNIGPGHLKGYDMGAVIFTLAENYFNLAEAALNGYGGEAEDYYDAGVTASFTYLGIPDSVSKYLGQPKNNIDYEFSSNKLEAIITQKWIALNGIDAIQSWFDYSRTGFPRDLPVSEISESTTDDRPVRLAYPSSEITSNSANLPDQPDVYSEKIFWAQ